MGLSEEGEDSVLQKFEEICLDLNMDTAAKEEAWQNYQKTLANYSLEGDQIHWLACALYEACRRMSTPTVGSGTMEGNCVSLTRLLRSSKLSLIQFFNKMRKWSDMANLPKSFRDKIDKLERNFAVSTVIFKKFEPIFLDIFVNPAQAVDAPRQPRGRKQRNEKRKKWTKNGWQLIEGRSPCSAQEVFNFAWTLFIQVKGNFPAISDDLVNSYHLLLCCIDWVFANALLGGRKDLLNKDFKGLPSDFLSVNFRPGNDAPCIMQLLCENHDGLVVEAKTIKEHWWKPFIKKLFEKKTLKGKFDNLSAVLEMGNFEENVKMINNLYEEYVLSVGDFDERIFLGEDAHEEIGTPGGQNTSDLSEQMARRSLKQHFDETKTLTPTTPLTGRRYLKEKEACVTPVTTATQSVSRLQNLLSGCKTCPSAALTALFKSCNKNPSQEITQRVKEMGETFCKHYAKQTEYPGASTDFARKRLHLGESLYFKTLEAIIEGEKQRLSAGDKDYKSSLQGLFENESFHRSLFACCLEIVIFSYNSQRTFPWIVDIFEFSPYQFYKVIEIIIRAEKCLSRDVVKHLNHIEESILESYAWKSDSPLWDAIKEDSVPTCEEVTPPSHMEGWRMGPALPAKHKKLRSLVGTIKPVVQKSSEILSPGGGTAVVAAADRFCSPSPGNAKRRLFGVGPSAAVAVANSTTSSTFTVSAPSPSAGSSHVQVPVSSMRPGLVPPTPPPGVTIISSPSQLPGDSYATSTGVVSGSTPTKEGGRSILLNQLTGRFTSSVVVPNKVANFLAPSSMLPKSDSPPPLLTGIAESGSKEGATLTAVSRQSDKSSSSITTTTTTTATSSASSSSSTASATQAKPSVGGNQQAIVAVMEDGRQILIPVQIENPSVSAAAPSGTTAAALSTVTTASSASVSSVSSVVPSSPNSTTTFVSIRKPGQGFCKVQLKLDKGVDMDHSYNKPKKTGSLSLFFRKVYHLASVRLRDIFEKLSIEDDALMKKIWTCFEYVLVHHAGSLMCDRHLDQLIMCSIYLISKVTENPQTFQNIMKCYRLQPQAHSHVYRSVLLSSRHRHGSGSSDGSGESGTSSPDAVEGNKTEVVKDEKKKQPTVRSTSTLPHPQPNSQPPTPTKFVGHAENFNFEDERGDLIQFYNLVFLKKIRDFAMKFMEKNMDLTDQPKLSPLPAGRYTTLSPRRVSNTLFISPASGQSPLNSSHNRGLSYSINRSPSKELQAINKMIRQGAALLRVQDPQQASQQAHVGMIKSAKRVLEVDQEDDSVHSPATKRRILTVNAGPGGVEPVHPLIRRLQEMDQH